MAQRFIALLCAQCILAILSMTPIVAIGGERVKIYKMYIADFDYKVNKNRNTETLYSYFKLKKVLFSL